MLPVLHKSWACSCTCRRHTRRTHTPRTTGSRHRRPVPTRTRPLGWRRSPGCTRTGAPRRRHRTFPAACMTRITEHRRNRPAVVRTPHPPPRRSSARTGRSHTGSAPRHRRSRFRRNPRTRGLLRTRPARSRNRRQAPRRSWVDTRTGWGLPHPRRSRSPRMSRNSALRCTRPKPTRTRRPVAHMSSASTRSSRIGSAPPPPHVSPEGHPPQFTTPPHWSGTDPHCASISTQVRGAHPGASSLAPASEAPSVAPSACPSHTEPGGGNARPSGVVQPASAQPAIPTTGSKPFVIPCPAHSLRHRRASARDRGSEAIA